MNSLYDVIMQVGVVRTWLQRRCIFSKWICIVSRLSGVTVARGVCVAGFLDLLQKTNLGARGGCFRADLRSQLLPIVYKADVATRQLAIVYC